MRLLRLYNGYYVLNLFYILIAFIFTGNVLGQTTPDFNSSLTICWKTKENNVHIKPFASDNINLYIPYINGNLASINIKTGVKNWIADLGGEIVSAPIIDKYDETQLYIATKPFVVNNRLSDNSEKYGWVAIRSISRLTGITLWKLDVKAAEEIFLYDNKESIIIISENGDIAAVSKTSVLNLWKVSLGKQLTAIPFFFDDTVTVAIANKIASLSLKNADTYFQKVPESPATSLLIFSPTEIFWGDKLGKVFGLNIFDKRKKEKLWKFQNGAQISHITQTPKGLLLTSLDNFVYLISAEKGKLIWKKRLSGRITIKPFVKESIIILTSSPNSEAFVLDLNTGKIINQITLANENFFLGPPVISGNLLIFPTAQGVFAFRNSSINC